MALMVRMGVRWPSHAPNAIVPEASKSASEAQSIYRFWSNSNVSVSAILNSHIDGTADRSRACEAVLTIQDTTDLNFTSHPATEGLGYLNQTKQQGIKVHSTFGVSGAGEPLGLLGQHCWVREQPPTPKKGRKAAEQSCKMVSIQSSMTEALRHGIVELVLGSKNVSIQSSMTEALRPYGLTYGRSSTLVSIQSSMTEALRPPEPCPGVPKKVLFQFSPP